jgi:hypothetical protein
MAQPMFRPNQRPICQLLPRFTRGCSLADGLSERGYLDRQMADKEILSAQLQH